MSFSIIDKNTKEVIQGGFSTENDALDALIDNGATEEEINSVYDVVQDSSNMPKNSQKTTRAERMEAFGKDAEYWPSVAEQFMKGNTDFNLGTLKAGVSDFLSFPGRLATSYMNYAKNAKGPQDWNEEFNLGLRPGEEGTNIFSSMLRDPTTPIITGGGKFLAKGVSKGAKIGGKALDYMLGKIIPKAAPVIGKSTGAATAGAVEGLLTEQVSSELNQREPEYGLSALLGGGFEGAGSLISQILQKNGKEYLKSVASSLRLGNTERKMTDDDFVEFMRDPRNVDALEKALKNISFMPMVNDRGKGIERILPEERKNAVSVLKDEPVFNNSFETGIDPNASVVERDLARRKNALNATDVEEYRPKTIFKEGGINQQDLAYAPDVENDLFRKKTRSEMKSDKYQSNMQKNLEDFATKYDKIDNSFKNLPSVKGVMTPEEEKFIETLKAEIAKDRGVISGYDPNKLIETNKFFGNRVVFGDKFNSEIVEPFRSSRNMGVSQEFKSELEKIISDARTYGADVSSSLGSSVLNNEVPVIERAFMYSKSGPFMVKKGYKNAVDKFADELSAYADESVGRPRIDAKGKEYMVDKDRVRSYSFNYLKKVQDILSERGALNADEIVSLYGMATNVNDKKVQDAIIHLLENLGVPKSTVDNFKKVGGNYAMLNKSRTRLKKNPMEDNPLKGTLLAPIYPQEGVNSINGASYYLERGNLRNGGYGVNPTGAGRLGRWVQYNLGVPLEKDAFGNSGNNR